MHASPECLLYTDFTVWIYLSILIVCRIFRNLISEFCFFVCERTNANITGVVMALLNYGQYVVDFCVIRNSYINLYLFHQLNLWRYRLYWNLQNLWRKSKLFTTLSFLLLYLCKIKIKWNLKLFEINYNSLDWLLFFVHWATYIVRHFSVIHVSSPSCWDVPIQTKDRN